jgi:type II secretory pathway pseudopilin PulG
MRATPRAQARADGVNLIEVTIAFAVIVTLALVLTPSIADIINDSRVARARNDCDTIASAIVQFHKDTGFFPQWARAHAGRPGETRERLVLLTGPGNAPAGDAGNAALRRWLIPSGQLSTGALADQLIANTPVYPLRGPSTEFGWNGPYLSSPVGADPWNNRYMVNIGAAGSSQGPQATGGINSPVWVISAGPNGIIETPFTQPGTSARLGGDDIGRRIQ